MLALTKNARKYNEGSESGEKLDFLLMKNLVMHKIHDQIRA